MNVKQKNKAMRLILGAILVLIVCLMVGSVFLVLWFGSALGQEPDTLPILVAAGKLHMNGTDIEPVGGSQQRWLARNQDAVIEMMEGKGWRFTDQMGAGLLFSQNTSTTEIICRLYSKKYVICQAKSIP